MALLASLGALIAGMIIGSFLNACAYQIAESRPCWRAYRCCACGTRLRLHQIVPIFSWLRQKGRSECCGIFLGHRYLWTDFLLGPVFVFLWIKYPHAQAAAYCLMASGLFLASLVDLDHRMIPDRCSLGGVAAGLLCCLLVPSLMGEHVPLLALRDSVMGSVVGAGTLGLVALVGGWTVQKEAMGLGDIKLMGAIGAFLGWHCVFWVLPVSSMVSCLLLIKMVVRPTVDTAFSFGPFLAIGALSWLAGGGFFISHYWEIVAHLSGRR
jgi:leader peptidase (prepilin peptidase)/N-methyltransferase